ncbi:MAG: zinc ribbon domain-containing protein [Oscillospiraceae bacterium]|nr:zinc ribbon domain-containing protein [Oscillospiraceae bacterium]
MKFCSNCGKEISDAAAICINCGAEVKPETETVDKANTALVVVSVLFPIVGLILGAVQRKTSPNAAKTYATAAIIAWAVSFAIGFFIGLVG